MFIETRFYDSGTAEAKLSFGRPVTDSEDYTGKYDFYVDDIGDLENLKSWIEENMVVESGDIMPLV